MVYHGKLKNYLKILNGNYQGKFIMETPLYIINEAKVKQNLEILLEVKKKTSCKIILALKAFSMFSIFPLMRKYLDGTAASSLHEAKLGYEEFGKDVHLYIPAYKDGDMEKYVSYVSDISFNSVSQWLKYKDFIEKQSRKIHCGLRINPEYSASPSNMYNPCSPYSRLGVRAIQLEGENLKGLEGFHFHTLCQQNADALEKTLLAVEEKFGKYLCDLKWLNFGGGHHITREDYDLNLLIDLINHFQKKYQLKVILEPGEANVLNAGELATTVLDIVENQKNIAILDTSAAAHMPDVIEMPYRPPLKNSALPGEKAYTYLLTGNTCLAGDIIGEYSFDEPLKINDRIFFEDMALYTMVKNNTFNGINLPSIYILKESGEMQLIKEFGYSDFKNRLS